MIQYFRPVLPSGEVEIRHRRKAFKGGRIDEFLQAGEAEAKYGPGRYAAVSEREWKMEVSREESEVRRQDSLAAYNLQKGQLLQDHAILSVCGLAAVWSYVTPTAFLSYGVGSLLGLLYIVLLQRTHPTPSAPRLSRR